MRAGADNVPTPLNAKYYTQRASAGVVITEGTAITAGAHGYPSARGIYSDGLGLLTGRLVERSPRSSPSLIDSQNIKAYLSFIVLPPSRVRTNVFRLNWTERSVVYRPRNYIKNTDAFSNGEQRKL
jgi:hypothetical protein